MIHWESYQIILASRSPRRKELLSALGIPFATKSIDIEENYPPDLPVNDVALYLAKKKALVFKSSIKPGEIIIAADTTVIKDGVIYGKPSDESDAKRILQALSGGQHSVITGVCIMTQEEMIGFSCSTDVIFKPLKEEEVDYYIQTCKPFDKAGAYAIQEWIGMIGIDRIEGDYYNIVGLPVSKLWGELNRMLSSSV